MCWHATPQAVCHNPSPPDAYGGSPFCRQISFLQKSQKNVVAEAVTINFYAAAVHASEVIGMAFVFGCMSTH
jgi:hypothetical protein